MRIMAGLVSVYVLVIIALAVGWVLNIISLFHSVMNPITGIVVLRAIGIIVAPLGGVLGYF